jgi:hypothetical protein
MHSLRLSVHISHLLAFETEIRSLLRIGKGEVFKLIGPGNSGCIWEAQLIAVCIVQEKGITGLDGG